MTERGPSFMYENRWAILDGSLFTDKKRAHALISRELSFPAYYGNNLDALHDCLTEMGQTKIELFGCAQIRRSLAAYGDRLLEVFEESARENPNLKVTMYD